MSALRNSLLGGISVLALSCTMVGVTGTATAATAHNTPLATRAATSSPADWLVNAHSNKCLEIVNSSTSNGARAQLWTCKGQAGSIWRLKPDGTLRNPHSGKCLEIANSSASNGARAQLWTCKGQAGSIWRLKPDGTLRNPHSGKCLEIANSSASNGARAQLWTCKGQAGAVWGP
ncbi:RICIN domain-containing protein [Streptomyces gelaticus]|uniref:RICIN domain-containing protein n=1 Tax=Streptomyces gelaticus TaxID=285446 RepID=UPI0037A2ED3B